jgi:outer membrane autotransporter protein
VQVISFDAPSYNETATTGSSTFALNYNAQNGTETRVELGSWIDKTTLLGNCMPIDVFGRLAYAHDWESNPSLQANFLSLPTASFVVDGARQPDNLALVTSGAELRLNSNWSLMAKFDGEFGQNSETYTGTAKLSYAW